MESLDYWRLCEELTIIQAALLIAGEDPSSGSGYVETWVLDKRPAGYEAAKSAVAAGLRKGKINGDLRPEYEEDINGNILGPIDGSIDLATSTVEVESLRSWLRGRGFNSGFFFPSSSALPPYLDREDPHYAPKLAAAVRAWEAVTTDPTYSDNGKHVKQNLITWLTAHAAELQLLKPDGEINSEAIENQVAKVANWQEKGGAPKTPGG